jgi:hypothetical protein
MKSTTQILRKGESESLFGINNKNKTFGNKCQSEQIKK